MDDLRAEADALGRSGETGLPHLARRQVAQDLVDFPRNDDPPLAGTIDLWSAAPSGVLVFSVQAGPQTVSKTNYQVLVITCHHQLSDSFTDLVVLQTVEASLKPSLKVPDGGLAGGSSTTAVFSSCSRGC